ncbi:MAG TPA: diacylglycerol kinase family lipid kinase [Thermoleophilia bacterium]|nr:diacylglycerol kinase family lipid kinase [Thermoleophilia bacterium]
MAVRPRLAAVINPHSGGGGHRRDIPLILSALRGLGYDVEKLETEAAGDASGLARRAVEAGFDIVAVLGGDGTVNEAINGLAGSDVPLAIIPTGTVNVLAMELGIPLDPPDAVKLLDTTVDHVSWIDLGLAGDRYFGLMAGVGMDAAVVAALHPAMKKALKEAAFAVQGLATYLTHEEALIRVVSEERTVEGYFAVFGNSSNYGGAFGITPLADMRDGLLDVCVLKDKSFVSTVWYWAAALINAHIRHPKVEYFRTERADVSAVEQGKEVLVQTDGELAGRLPMECRVVPHALRVVVP